MIEDASRGFAVATLMKNLLSILAALSDESRLRAFLLLRDQELCVCQIIDVLGLSPATVSKHMSILHQAGLVDRRKEGKWHYYRWADAKATSVIGRAMRLAREGAGDDVTIIADSKRCCGVQKKELTEVCECYRS